MILLTKLAKKDFKSPIAYELAGQLESMWTMIREAINLVSDEEWTHGIQNDKDWYYSLRVYHIIETAEFYSRDTHQGMQWGARLGKVNWWETITHQEAATKVGKSDMLIYSDEIAKYIRDKLQKFSDQDLLEQDGFHWFSSILIKYVYLIRHNTYHLGELTQFLRLLGKERIKWD
ncbi:MAG: hypothetical protein ACFFCH_03920 [Promethearchaeota archaeon]